MKRQKGVNRIDKREFVLSIQQGRVVNKNPFIDLGYEGADLIKIVVAIFDLMGFTRFFHSISVNKELVVTSFINGLLYWFSYRFKEDKWWPIFSKFMGDGVLMVWELGRQKLSNVDIIAIMNLCWNIVSARDSYEDEFLPEFNKKIGARWRIKYPKQLKVGLSLGHAVRYTRDNERTDYISESINIASRLVKFDRKIPFIAHSDIVLGSGPKKHNYIEKSIRLRGIEDICIYVDKEDFRNAGFPKKFRKVGQ